jgi:pyruvate formate lyase activating enzyme
MTTGLVFNLQRYSLHDGPGVRTTVFMKGCPLSCSWCHNPESQSPVAGFLRMETRCMACGRCTEEERRAPAIRELGPEDLEACPTGAVQQVGRERQPAELVRELLRDRIFFDDSGGGVTFSGGEPLMQPDFLQECLGLLKAEGVHTALDTCGFAPWAQLEAAAAQVPLVLYDIKLMDEARHRKATGQSNRIILDNLRALSRVHPEIWIRIPVVPGVNDDVVNLEATARFLAPLPGVRRVDLLPYHAIGQAKFARLGLTYTLPDLASPAPEAMETAAAIFRARGLTTLIGGNP